MTKVWNCLATSMLRSLLRFLVMEIVLDDEDDEEDDDVDLVTIEEVHREHDEL